MKHFIKVTFIALLAIIVANSANAQQVRKEQKKAKPQVEQTQNKPFHFENQEGNDVEKKNPFLQKTSRKPNIWDVLPADGYVPTGDKAVDKKRKREIQIRWAKENPKDFQALIKKYKLKTDFNKQ